MGRLASIKGKIKENRDRGFQKRQEKRDKQSAGIEEARLALANRMPALKSPLLWWIPFILGPIIYAVKSAFRLMFDAAGVVLRPIGTAITYAIQIPAKIFGGFLGVAVFIAVILGLIYLFIFTSPGIAVWFVEHGIHDVKDLAVWVAAVPGEIAENFRETFRMRIAVATGEYWQGEKEGEEVGIFIDRVMPLQSKFYAGDPIIISVDLRGSGDFDEVDGTVKASCLLIEENAFAEKIYPSDEIELWVLSNSKEGFECEFLPYETIDEPTKEVEAMIEFPFETSGRVTLTFMDEATIRQLRREDKDPNVIYDIPEEPVSLFQPGPIMVGLGTVRSNPIGISGTKEILTRLGFTLQNRWEGEIINITGVEIIVDSGISLPDAENTIDMEGPVGIDGGRNKYIVEREFLGKLTYFGEDPITTFTSLNFRMKLDRGVLKDTVISHKEIEVKVNYEYRLSEKTRIQLDYNPFREVGEETKGICGTEACYDNELCCERDSDQQRECKRVTACPTYWTDVSEEIKVPGVECGDTTCAGDDKCCECDTCCRACHPPAHEYICVSTAECPNGYLPRGDLPPVACGSGSCAQDKKCCVCDTCCRACHPPADEHICVDTAECPNGYLPA